MDRTRKLMLLLVTAVGLLLVTTSTYAHHGSAAYDMGKTVTVTGTVSEFNFVNPHVMISMDVKNASGGVDKWQGELTSPNRLARGGWTKSTLKPGDQLTITGGVAKSGANTMWISKAVKNGVELPLGTGD
jgi:hypothetical protein